MQTARILIIEDDHGSRNALAEILRDEGFEVRAVASGEEGLHCAERFQPSFAIVDVEKQLKQQDSSRTFTVRQRQ